VHGHLADGRGPADQQPARAVAQRARLPGRHAWSVDAGRGARLHRQRPRPERDQHHDRRHERPGHYLKTTDGFFARLSPRLDAVEEVTMTTAGGGAETSGQGAIQIRFVSRQGTNDYHGSVYEYFRRDSLNANTWFNNRDLPPDPATGKAPRA